LVNLEYHSTISIRISIYQLFPKLSHCMDGMNEVRIAWSHSQ
jgi:hypothetical protein